MSERFNASASVVLLLPGTEHHFFHRWHNTTNWFSIDLKETQMWEGCNGIIRKKCWLWGFWLLQWASRCLLGVLRSVDTVAICHDVAACVLRKPAMWSPCFKDNINFNWNSRNNSFTSCWEVASQDVLVFFFHWSFQGISWMKQAALELSACIQTFSCSTRRFSYLCWWEKKEKESQHRRSWTMETALYWFALSTEVWIQLGPHCNWEIQTAPCLCALLALSTHNPMAGFHPWEWSQRLWTWMRCPPCVAGPATALRISREAKIRVSIFRAMLISYRIALRKRCLLLTPILIN